MSSEHKVFHDMTHTDVSPQESARRERQSSLSLIQSAELRERLGGVSDMWLWRHRDELPTPIVISGRKFWRLDEMNKFLEQNRASA